MKRPKSLKEALKGVLNDEEMGHLRRAYDIVGDIAIVEIPEELVHKEREIARVLLDSHKNVNVVCKKKGIHHGEFRVQPLEILAGEDRKETLHKENNCRVYLNPETCYFSPRLSTERKRIAGLIMDGEIILVMFSGVAPYPCVIEKNSKVSRIVGVEKNPAAHEYAQKNIKANKLRRTELHNGDVREVVPLLGEKFDRIIMPLPKNAEDFLDVALGAVGAKGIIHFYDFLHEDDFQLAKDKVTGACDEYGFECSFLGLTRCGQHAPRIYRICLDVSVTRC